MDALQIDKAYDFYKRFIRDYTNDKSEIYKQYGFTLQGSVGSKDWEVFAAILLDDRAKPGDGTDLIHYEVKSAITGTSFEYQYHKNRGLEKLEDDKKVDHVFIARGRHYADIEVWLVNRARMIPIFDKWLPELKQNYASGERQRFRKSVTYSFVANNGSRLLEIKNGVLIHPSLG